MAGNSLEGQLVFRADSDSQIGAGHVMRCLALAQAWQAAGGSATFVSRCKSDALRRRIESANIAFVRLGGSYPDPTDLATTLRSLGRLAGHSRSEQSRPRLVLDGYRFDPTYQRAIQTAGYRLLVIDDTGHLSHYHADLLLNQNIYAETLDYSIDPDTQLLLGTRYALLRPEFLGWRGWQRHIPDIARKVLVTLGGADPDNATHQVVQILQRLDLSGIEAKIVVGPVSAHRDALRQTVAQSAASIKVLTAATEMPALMAWADVAISGGGSTCWEMAFMGLPNCIVVLAENQAQVAHVLNERRVAIHSRWSIKQDDRILGTTVAELILDRERRREMSERGRMLVDGDGAARVIEALLRLGRSS